MFREGWQENGRHEVRIARGMKEVRDGELVCTVEDDADDVEIV